MIEWILKNKEWLFSGIGVVVLSSLFIVIRNLVFRKNQILSESDVTIRDDVPIATIQPNEIYEAVKNLPPFQREKVFSEYEGLKVAWNTEFSSASVHWDDKQSAFVHLQYKNRLSSTITIFCTVKISDNKELKIAKSGAKLDVTGEIVKVNDLGITLSKANLIFK